jgi:hypothetical protein
VDAEWRHSQIASGKSHPEMMALSVCAAMLCLHVCCGPHIAVSWCATCLGDVFRRACSADVCILNSGTFRCDN